MKAVEPSDDARVRAMLAGLRRKGLKMTAQRVAIVETFASDLSHPTAQELYERLRGELSTLSFATVYNTLDALATAGLTGALRFGGAARFDPNTLPHHHAVCDRCGAITDVPTPSLVPTRATQDRLARTAPGFTVRAEERVFRGTCARCSRGRKKRGARQEGPGSSQKQ